MMSVPNPHLPTVILMAVLAILSACATGQPIVVEKLDKTTAVTITYVGAPLVLSPETRFDQETGRDYTQVGAMEVNRMGALQYYLWIGITEVDQAANAAGHPNGYDSVVFILDGEELRLDVLGWSPEEIGASEPVYRKLYATSADAYYRVTLDQIQLLAYSDSLKLRTTGPQPKEFLPRFGQESFQGDWSEFVRIVLQ